ncbi:uncharacterized protein KD926_009493 [Aspergillus affinis]|uniref:uncharacterized protein n=1 Tax=Aspergillus affinis TaxID=1070780 RepID=UPI0022FE7928|nr:uncharacterized protein KD926_009493 [Aspergillus affinis]KAI9039350.1 hypothetical protein KD926_009493 [Aspergillus affinis]
MVTSSWFAAALGVVGFIITTNEAVGTPEHPFPSTPSHDLHNYHDRPGPTKYSGVLSECAKRADHTRSGNWTEFDCTHPVFVDFSYYTPSEQWKQLNADAAWRDVVRIWKETEKGHMSFIESVTDTLKVLDSNCGEIGTGSCLPQDCPRGADGSFSGPAAQLIWNSLVEVHHYYEMYYNAFDVFTRISSTVLEELEKEFAPISPEQDTEKWLFVLTDLFSLGTLSTAGPFIKTDLKERPYFFQKSSLLENPKDITIILIGNNPSIAHDMLDGDKPSWVLSPANFSDYMGQVTFGWGHVASHALAELFSGTEEGLETLWSTISNGKLADGAFETGGPQFGNAHNEIRPNVQKKFFGFVIPALWKVSQTYTFIIDSGYGCDEDRPLSNYLDDNTMNATGVCLEEKRYYLVYPNKGNKFSTPQGLESLPKEDLVKGSVRTWIHNGKENRGGFGEPIDKVTMENLIDADIMAPGFIRIPVCSAERAIQSWKIGKKGSNYFYPCDIPPGKNTCRESTFEDQTSDASPSIDDCLTIIKNIEGDASTDYTHQVVGKRHREILSFGSCSFGVEATKVHGNVNFVIGGQNAIDIIRDSIKRFSRDSKVGARGEMNCTGNIKDQPIKWGIY